MQDTRRLSHYADDFVKKNSCHSGFLMLYTIVRVITIINIIIIIIIIIIISCNLHFLTGGNKIFGLFGKEMQLINHIVLLGKQA